MKRLWKAPMIDLMRAVFAIAIVLAGSTSAFCGDIHDAAKVGDLAKVKALLKTNPALVSSKDDHSDTPLKIAASDGHKDIVALLLDSKADPNARDSVGATPLHWAALKGDKDVAALLLAHKADVNARATPGWTPLQLAAASGNKALVQLLLDNKADVSAVDDQGWTALARARDQHHDDVAELLAARASADMAKYVSADGITIPKTGTPKGTGIFISANQGSEMPMSLKGDPKVATLKFTGTFEPDSNLRLAGGTEKFKPTQIQTSNDPDKWLKIVSFSVDENWLLVVTDESGASYKIFVPLDIGRTGAIAGGKKRE